MLIDIKNNVSKGRKCIILCKKPVLNFLISLGKGNDKNAK